MVIISNRISCLYADLPDLRLVSADKLSDAMTVLCALFLSIHRNVKTIAKSSTLHTDK